MCLKTATVYLHIINKSFLKKRKLKIVLPEDPDIILLGIYLKDAPLYYKDTCSTTFIAALFIIPRNWKEPRFPSTEKWIKKRWYIYTRKYYSAAKNNDIMKFAGKWMDLENIFLSEVTQSQKTTHGKYSLISGIPSIQLTDHMKLERKKDQRADASLLLRRENKKEIKGSRGWAGLGRKRRGRGKRGEE